MEQDLRIARVRNAGLSEYWNYTTEHLLPSTNFCKDYYLGSNEIESKFLDMTPEQAPLGLKVFEAQAIEDFYLAIKLTVKRKKIKLHDVYQFDSGVLISARAKAIIEELDPLAHQYYPVEIYDRDSELRHQEPYYVMFIRRYISLECDQELTIRLQPYQSITSAQKQYYSALEVHPEYREFLKNMYCWRQPFSVGPFYLSQSLLNALRDQGCTGLDDATDKKNDTQGASIIYV
jgi:hypothetical protein